MSPAPAASIPADARPDTTRSGLGERWRAGWDRYWFDPVPVERVDVFARIIAVVVAFTVVSKDGWDFSVRAIRADGPQWLELPTNMPTSQRVPAHFILTERDAELDVGADMMELQAIMGASTNAETAAQ